MKLRAIAGFVCCAALLGLPALASAQSPIPTTITRDSAFPVGSDLAQIGRVVSPNPKCRVGRTVKLFYTIGADATGTLVDTDRTSFKGVWVGSGDGSSLSALRYNVSRKTFGRRGHRRTCAAATGEIHDRRSPLRKGSAASRRGIVNPGPISIDNLSIVGTSSIEAAGHLVTGNRKCLAGRTVKVFITYISGKKQVDTDLTSANGMWGAIGNDDMSLSIRVTVTKKTYGPRKHRRTCPSASVSEMFA